MRIQRYLSFLISRWMKASVSVFLAEAEDLVVGVGRARLFENDERGKRCQ